MEVFHNQDDAYARWLREHPGGYVLNERIDAPLLLHRATCRNLRTVGVAKGQSTTAFPKACSIDRGELETRARGQGRQLHACGNCDP
jgi:hypothetical protein